MNRGWGHWRGVERKAWYEMACLLELWTLFAWRWAGI